MNIDHKFVDDPVGAYLAAVAEVPPLSREEEIRCVQHIRAGDDQAEGAGERLAEANLQLVVAIAERRRNDHVHILDLIQQGNDGLLVALHAFRDSAQESFSAHATPYIERAIAKAIPH